MSRALRTLLSAAALLAGCASGPSLDRAVTITEDDPVEVVYEQYQSGLRQTLLTPAVVDPKELYSAPGSDPLAKALPTVDMQVVLDTLATYGFFDHAMPMAQAGAVSSLQVRIGPRQQVWSKVPTMGLDELQQYHEAMAAFLNIYNATESFHAGRGDNSVLEEAERLRRRYEEMQRKSEGSRGQGQP